jgi:hypothetical protein
MDTKERRTPSGAHSGSPDPGWRPAKIDLEKRPKFSRGLRQKFFAGTAARGRAADDGKAAGLPVPRLHPVFPAPSHFGVKRFAKLRARRAARTRVFVGSKWAAKSVILRCERSEPRRMNRPQKGRRPSRRARARTSRANASAFVQGDGLEIGRAARRLASPAMTILDIVTISML